MLRAFALAIAAIAVTTAGAVEIAFQPRIATDCGRASVVATSSNGQRVENSLTLRATVALDLDPRLAWRIETTADRCWGATAFVSPGTSSVTVPVWPRRTLRGTIAVPRGTRAPAQIDLRIASPPGTSAPAMSETTIRCAVEDLRFTCASPAAPLDIRVAAEGFAPHYLWDNTREDLGQLTLSAGTLVTGRALLPGGQKAGVHVELRPASHARSPEDRRRVVAQTRSAKTNSRGFFELANVPAGQYVAVATMEGWSPAEQPVNVEDRGTEVSLGKDLLLAELATLDVVLSPAVDAQQRPWQIQLHRAAGGNLIPVADGSATPLGQWVHRGIEAGAYTVTVRDANGSTVLSDGIFVSGGTTHLPIRIDQVPVRGIVTLGRQPVAARLQFKDGFGKTVSLTSDAEGRFDGTLPKEGEWNVEVRRSGSAGTIVINDVEVRRSETTGFADVDLALPHGRVHGTVVTADGRPVESSVRLRREGKTIASFHTAADGTFDVNGLESGDVLIAAAASGQESDVLPHRIGNMEDEPVRIVVRKRRAVRARLLAPGGRPVSGAQVNYFSPSAGGWKEVITDPHGEFTIAAGAADAQVPVTIVAAGFPVKLTALPAVGEERVDLSFAPIAGLISIAWDNRRWPPPVIRGPAGEFYGLAALLNRPDEVELMPARRNDRGIQVIVEPGDYTVCTRTRATCETRRVAAGARETIDATKWE